MWLSKVFLFKMSGMRVGITHKKIDLDAGSCIRFLEILDEVDRIEFGVEKAKEYEGKADKIIFVDTYPSEEPREGEVEIFSQHLIEKILNEEQLKTMQALSFLPRQRELQDLMRKGWRDGKHW